MKSYLVSTLQPDESIIARGRVHGAFLIAPATVSILFFLGVCKALLIWRAAGISPWFWTALAVPALYFFDKLIFWATAEAAVTSRRVLFKSGLFARTITEVSLSKVESAAIDEPLIGRVFGFADLIVTGSGGREVTIPALSDVMKFRAAVQNATASI